MEKLIGIYKITSPNNRVYIGQSVQIGKRWKGYRKFYKGNEGQIILNNSFIKYGVENHIFEIIEECLEEDLNCRERYWQDFYDVLNGGLNLVLQECGEQRRVLSEETIEKRRVASTGERNGMFGRRGILNPNFGKIMSDEDKLKSSIKMKGKYDGELNPFYGKKHSEDTKSIISKKAKEKIGVKNGFYGRTHTDEYKKQSSERQTDFYKNNPQVKEYLKNIFSIGVYHTPKGEFISQRDAAEANNISRTTVKSRCVKNSDNKVGYNGSIPKEFRGEKTWKEHGWFFIEKPKEGEDCISYSA